MSEADWPVPQGALAGMSNSQQSQSEKVRWASQSYVVPVTRSDAVRSYRAQLADAGFDLADAVTHGSTRGEFVGFRASRGGVDAFVVLTEIASRTYISMNFDT